MYKELIKSRLSFMLLQYIVIVSGFFTFISTIIQIYIDYENDLRSIDSSIRQVQNSYSHSIANSLWHLDVDQINVQIEGILRLRDIEYIQIIERKQGHMSVFLESGNKEITSKLEKRFQLTYGKDNNTVIGEVYIVANLDHLYDRILGRFYIVLATQMVKTFLVSFIILFIIYQLIAKKLIKISQYAKRLGHQNIGEELVISGSNPKRKNELDELVESLNQMRINLLNYLRNRDEAEHQLREYKSHLEDLVLKRTKQLNDKNELLEQKIKEISTIQDQMIAQEKLASLGNLTSGIAHEINNPLNFVINFAQISKNTSLEILNEIKATKDINSSLKAKIEDELDDLVNMTNEITNHGKRAENIIKSMLEHSRTGDGSAEREETDLHDLIEENLNFAFHAMRAKYRGFHINFTKDYDQSIPKVKILKGDMARVFLNMFSNAFYSMIKKHDQDSEYISEIAITTSIKSGLISVKIRDNGLGIDKSILEEIFNPFFTTKPAGEGTGLGLSLSYEIITALHGGNLIVHSEPGEFAEFIIQLPST